jgi:hypothetical protein
MTSMTKKKESVYATRGERWSKAKRLLTSVFFTFYEKKMATHSLTPSLHSGSDDTQHI